MQIPIEGHSTKYLSRLLKCVRVMESPQTATIGIEKGDRVIKCTAAAWMRF